MAKSMAMLVIDPAELENRIFLIRRHRIMLDSDLAKLYGVPTHRLNEQVQRNLERFPPDFAYQLTQQEFSNLISQNAISKPGRGGRRKLPWVFTEHGVAMLSGILRSPRAVQVNIAIMRAFVRMRQLLSTPGELVSKLNELSKSVQLHEEQIKLIADVLRHFMGPPPPPAEPSKRKIGFRPEANGKMSVDGHAPRKLVL